MRLQAQKITKNLEYPAGLGSEVAAGQHYMMIDSYESQNALESVGTKRSSIALYIPPNALKTTIGANYEGLAGGVVMAKTGATLGLGGAGLFEDGAGVTGDLASKLLAKTDAGKNFMAASAGLAVNNHMALVYRGPSEFRTHDFVFQFFPKNKNDSTTMRTIINDLKNGMTPRLAGLGKGDNQRLTAPFFKSPRQYEITFMKGGASNEYLFKIGKSVLTSMTINYDPQGIVGFHEDGAPVQTTLSLNFKEIEYVISGDSVSKESEELVNQAAIQANIATGTGGPPSDYRLKDNISLLQEEGFGIPNIYSFNYKWDAKTTWIGVMAQELLDTGYSNAVGIDSEGFYNVDYSRLGFPMIGVRQ